MTDAKVDRRLAAAEELITTLRMNVRAFRDRLDASQAVGDELARVLLDVLPPATEPASEHTHLLGDANVCCLMAARQVDAPTRRHALAAIAAWQADRTAT